MNSINCLLKFHEQFAAEWLVGIILTVMVKNFHMLVIFGVVFQRLLVISCTKSGLVCWADRILLLQLYVTGNWNTFEILRHCACSCITECSQNWLLVCCIRIWKPVSYGAELICNPLSLLLLKVGQQTMHKLAFDW